jgi:hypothetical protein
VATLSTARNNPDFAVCVEKIEAAYEFMLAYAAQGREREPTGGGAGPSIRNFLTELELGLVHVTSAARLKMAELQAGVEALQALEVFSEQLQNDAERALNVVRVVLTSPALSSQLIDNLNASVALRCLLTDLFVLDEAIQQHVRAGLARPAV